jgi:recombinational DNA repair protein (RecF pathway)
VSYKTYITEALVCGASDSNTADRSFLLFTRDAGMLYASAKSVRKEESKHRYALQECSHAKVTLVRGKSGWKVTGAEPIQNFYSATETREVRSFLRNTIILLRRVMHGETPHPEVFDDVISACEKSHDYPSTKLESILALRILSTLGYIAPQEEYNQLLGATFPHELVGTFGTETEKHCRTAIDHALLESQL